MISDIMPDASNAGHCGLLATPLDCVHGPAAASEPIPFISVRS